MLTLCLIICVMSLELRGAASQAISSAIPAVVSLNSELASVNGSSLLGHCSSALTLLDITLFCTEPASSVLFDGVIPTLTGLDSDMWASQLLTLQLDHPDSGVAVNFATLPSSAHSQRVEVVMFNCPQWGISVEEIELNTFPERILYSIAADLTSCESLVRVCTTLQSNNLEGFSVNFTHNSESHWIHLAEVTVYNDSSICPPDAIVDGTIFPSPLPPTAPSATTTELGTDLCSSTPIVLASVITATLTTLLTTLMFALVLFAVCKSHPLFTSGKKFSAGGGGVGGPEREYEEMDGDEEGVVTVPMSHAYVIPTPKGDKMDAVDIKEGRDYEQVHGDDEVVSNMRSTPGTGGTGMGIGGYGTETGHASGGGEVERLYEDMDGEIGTLAAPQSPNTTASTEMVGGTGVPSGYLEIRPRGLEEEGRTEEKNEESIFTLQKNEAYAINFRLPNSDDYYQLAL